MKLALAETVWGPHIVPANDVNVGLALLLYGEFSIGQVAVCCALLRPGDTALDVGANIGAIALPMMHAVGPTGRVICFEPQAPLARACHATLALNADNPGQFSVRQCAVGAEPGTVHVPPLDYDAAANNFGCASMLPDGDTPVPVAALDHMVLPKVRFVKIDVEGMEHAVIAGARELLARDRPFMVVENDRGPQYLQLIEQIEALDYECYWLLTSMFNPDNARGEKRDIYGPGCGSLDMLCLPKGAAWPEGIPLLPRATKEYAEKHINFAQ